MKSKVFCFIAVVALLAISMNGNGQVSKSGVLQPANGQCSAFIDNEAFEPKGTQIISATLVEPAAVKDESAAAVLNIIIGGSGQYASAETIQLSLPIAEPSVAGHEGFNIGLNHNGIGYTMIKGSSNAEVTDFIWSRDHKSFIISLSFNCTMHSTVFPEDGKRTVNLKGKLLRIKVMVPGAASASN